MQSCCNPDVKSDLMPSVLELALKYRWWLSSLFPRQLLRTLTGNLLSASLVLFYSWPCVGLLFKFKGIWLYMCPGSRRRRRQTHDELSETCDNYCAAWLQFVCLCLLTWSTSRLMKKITKRHLELFMCHMFGVFLLRQMIIMMVQIYNYFILPSNISVWSGICVTADLL